MVVESWSWLDTRLRAVQYGVPATRIFRRAGLLPDIRAASIPKFPTICWRRTADLQKLIEIDMSVVEDHEDRMTVLPLGEIIQIMYRHVVEKYSDFIEVRFNHKVLDVSQDQERNVAWADVEIGAEGETKRNDRIEADYIIGCDGASSTVRRSLFGRDWPGQTWKYRFIVQNVFYDGFEKHGWDGGNYMIDPEHWGLIARRGHGGLWRVTYADSAIGLTDEEYLERRPWHFKHMLPGHPEPGEYKIEATNLYNIHNRCVPSFKVGRIILAGDSASIVNPMGGYGCLCAVVETAGLADCLIGHHAGKAGPDILDTYATVRREIFLKYIDARSVKNLQRCASADPWTIAETDQFFGVIGKLNGQGKDALRDFLLKTSSIEYDFTQHYDKVPLSNREANGAGESNGNRERSASIRL